MHMKDPNSSVPKMKANFNIGFCSHTTLYCTILHDYLKELMIATGMLLNERSR